MEKNAIIKEWRNEMIKKQTMPKLMCIIAAAVFLVLLVVAFQIPGKFQDV